VTKVPEFVVDLGDPRSGRTYHIKLSGDSAVRLIGRRIGEEVPGELIGLSGYVLKITGGTDKDGFPMLPSVHGPAKRRILLSGPPGFRPRRKGERRAKTVRGNVISEHTRQINMKVVKYGEKPIEEILVQLEGGEEQGGAGGA